MIRIASFMLAVSLGVAPALSANYSATLASPAPGRFIVRDIVWHCGPAACQGVTAEGRPIVLCQALARQTGRVVSFLVDGRAFSADELDRCNASAKSRPAEARQ